MSEAPPGWEGLLDDDEQILWQGKPSARIIFSGRDIPESLMGAFFVGFSLFWIAKTSEMVSSSRGMPGAFQFFPLFGCIFLAIGAYMLVLKYPWKAFVRSRTNYTLTNKRGFIATDLFGARKLKSYPLTDSLELVQSAKGDTLWFATQRVTSRGKNGTRSYNRKIGFELISDGRKVMTLARTASKDTA